MLIKYTYSYATCPLFGSTQTQHGTIQLEPAALKSHLHSQNKCIFYIFIPYALILSIIHNDSLFSAE